MLVYHFDTNGLYLGHSDADESPLEPGVYLIPAFATDIPPPVVGDGKCAVFDGGWQVRDVVAAQPESPTQQIPDQNSGVPQVVSRFQARAALYKAGLLEAVEALMANPATDMLAKLAWQDAQEFRRQSPTVLAMGAALGLSEAQLDALFTAAATIQA